MVNQMTNAIKLGLAERLPVGAFFAKLVGNLLLLRSIVAIWLLFGLVPYNLPSTVLGLEPWTVYLDVTKYLALGLAIWIVQESVNSLRRVRARYFMF